MRGYSSASDFETDNRPASSIDPFPRRGMVMALFDHSTSTPRSRRRIRPRLLVGGVPARGVGAATYRLPNVAVTPRLGAASRIWVHESRSVAGESGGKHRRRVPR